MPKILQPLLSYRFHVLFGQDIDRIKPENSELLLLTQQIVKADVDLLNKKLDIVIRQPIIREAYDAVLDMLETNHQTIIIEPMSGGNLAMWSIHYTQCKCINYESSFDYSLNNVFCHKLTFEFKRAVTAEPFDWEKYGSSNEDTSIEGALTPEEAIKKHTKKK